MKSENEMKSFLEVMGLQDFKSAIDILMVGAMMTLPLIAVCALAEWLERLPQ